MVVEGLEDTESQACKTCKLYEALRQILRRPIGKIFGCYGQVYFDLIHVVEGYTDTAISLTFI